MTIAIYPAERAAGLAERIQNNRIVIASAVYPCDIPRPDIVERATAQNKGQPDLFYMESVLVNAGRNLNMDYFAPLEIWKARKSPEDKPLNYEHDQADIIGHLTSVIPTDGKGDLLGEDTRNADVPDDLRLVVSSVLYRAWDNEEQRNRINAICDEIAAGEDWATSMECLFLGYDYLVEHPTTKATKVLPRNKANAYLTKHLRAYGGTGTYEGHNVYRVLRNIHFSAQGLTKRPADPKSVIIPQKAEATLTTLPTNRRSLAQLLRVGTNRNTFRQYVK